MPPKKRGGRSLRCVKTKLGTRVRKNQNKTLNSMPVLEVDVLRESASPANTNSTITRKVTTTSNNEMQIKLSTEVIKSDTKEGLLLTENAPKNMRITRNNSIKAQPKLEIVVNEIKTEPESNVHAVKVMSRQQNNVPAKRKRKLVKNDSIESDDSYTTTKRRQRCNTKRRINKNNIKVTNETKAMTRKKVTNNKKPPAVEQTASEDLVAPAPSPDPAPDPGALPRIVTEVRNTEPLFEVTIIGAPPQQSPEPCAPSPSECPSWTQDISSSSTVTCLTVRTDDIVCFDNKLPQLRLTDMARAAPAPAPVPASPTAPDPVFVPAPDTAAVLPHGRARSASACTSSSTTSASSASSAGGSSASGSSTSSRDHHDHEDDIDRALEKLTTDFKRKDVEIIHLITCENRNVSPTLRKFRKRVCKALTEESEVIAHCNALKKLLIRDYEDLFCDIGPCVTRHVETPSDQEFIKPRDVRKVTQSDTERARTGRPEEVAVCPAPAASCPGPASRSPGPGPGPADERDDDDALSLFAESITGLDSSRRQDSLPPQDNSLLGDSGEYVPRPLNGSKKSETVTYRPSHISKRNEDGLRKETVKLVCEKQNADSTSMYRESQNYYENDIGVVEDSPWPWPEPGAPPATTAPSAPPGQPVFISKIYSVPNKFKTVVFLGVCFYNLASKCKREFCQFPHSELPASVVSARLRHLECDAQFVHEYMMMRSWAALRRRYGLAFVLEGARRGLVRLLLEMAIDFTRSSNSSNHPEDKALTVKVLEAIMLYMNTIDVREYGEFLKFPTTDGRLLCDILMESLASTPNFSRFKSIFVNLTEFMESIPRHFEFEVASALLERVCILPHEPLTAAAMLRVLGRASPRVLRNPMVGLFERRLAADERLARDFETLKRAASEAWSCGAAGGRSFSPDTTAPTGAPAGAPDCTSAVLPNAIDFQLVNAFRKLGEGIRPRRAMRARRRTGWFVPRGPPPGAPLGVPPLLRPLRPLFQLPWSRRNYKKRFVQDS